MVEAVNAALKSWLREIEQGQLLSNGTANEVALENLFCFSTSMKSAMNMRTESIDEFLIAAYRLYAQKLANAPQTMWFYAWFDEQAGQLRCSAAPAKNQDKLPFGCRTDVVDLPTSVSRLFLSSDYLEGIPWTELEEHSLDEDENDTDVEFRLTLFARQLS